MAAGFEVYNADGTLQFSTANRLVRLLTIISSGTVNGSQSVAAISTGTPLTVVNPANSSGGAKPVVTVAGTTVSWDWSATPSGSRVNNNIQVLVY